MRGTSESARVTLASSFCSVIGIQAPTGPTSPGRNPAGAPSIGAANTGGNPATRNMAMMHVAIYAGVPAANHAIKIIKQTYAEMAKKPRKKPK